MRFLWHSCIYSGIVVNSHSQWLEITFRYKGNQTSLIPLQIQMFTQKRKDGNDKLQITCAISQLILFYSILMVSGLAWNICMPVTILGEFKIPFFTFLKPWYNTTYKMNPKWLKMKYTLFLRFTEHSLKKRKVTKDTFVTYVFKEKMKHRMT